MADAPKDGMEHIKQGYLEKQGQVVKNWKKRWFVLDSCVLSYYEDANDHTPKGQMSTFKAQVRLLPESIRPHCAEVASENRVLRVAADSGEEIQAWTQAIRDAVDNFAGVQQPPVWKHDKACEKCGTEFSMLNRRHHCRNCGGSFCSKDADKALPLPAYGMQVPVRVCSGCYMSHRRRSLDIHAGSAGSLLGKSASNESVHAYSDEDSDNGEDQGVLDGAAAPAEATVDAGVVADTSAENKEQTEQVEVAAPKEAEQEQDKAAEEAAAAAAEAEAEAARLEAQEEEERKRREAEEEEARKAQEAEAEEAEKQRLEEEERARKEEEEAEAERKREEEAAEEERRKMEEQAEEEQRKAEAAAAEAARVAEEQARQEAEAAAAAQAAAEVAQAKEDSKPADAPAADNKAEEPGAPASPDEDMEQLQKGVVVHKLAVGRGGAKKTKLSLVRGDKGWAVSWESAKKKKEDHEILVKDAQILKGQKSDVFKRKENATAFKQSAHVSFSLLVPKRSLDVVCTNDADYQRWMNTLQKLKEE